MNIILEYKDSIYFLFKTWLGQYPKLFFFLRNLIINEKDNSRIIDKNTDIIIEGFPRSANSFSVGLFESYQDNEFKVAHHLHNPAQILKGIELAKPVIVLIRNPKDAVISLKALHEQHELMGNKKRSMKLSFISVLRAYILFYESIARKGDGQYVVARFENVIDDFSEVLNKTNEVFLTNFKTSSLNRDIRGRVKKRGYHALPTEQRNKIKKDLQQAYESLIENDEKICRVQNEAYFIYNKFLKSGK